MEGGLDLPIIVSRVEAITSLPYYPPDGVGNSQIKNLQYKRTGLERRSLRVAAIDATPVPPSHSNFRQKTSVFESITTAALKWQKCETSYCCHSDQKPKYVA